MTVLNAPTIPIVSKTSLLLVVPITINLRPFIRKEEILLKWTSPIHRYAAVGVALRAKNQVLLVFPFVRLQPEYKSNKINAEN